MLQPFQRLEINDTQGSLLAVLGHHMGCWVANPGWPYSRQMHSPCAMLQPLEHFKKMTGYYFLLSPGHIGNLPNLFIF